MYNRYIPRSDGTYQRNRVPDQPPAPSTRPQSSRPAPSQTPPQQHCETTPAPTPRLQTGNVGGFLRQLLPKDFDTGDLLIVLLMLLVAGDCEEERNNALLTLALYFFL